MARKNKNIQPGPEKQHSYIIKGVYDKKKKKNLLTKKNPFFRAISDFVQIPFRSLIFGQIPVPAVKFQGNPSA